MNGFDLKQQLADIYRQFPAADRRPVIGITGNYGEQTCKLGEGYYKQIEAAGGVPFIIPPSADRHELMNVLQHIDALLLSGGADINPLFCGEEPSKLLGSINSERDLPELLIARLAFNRQMPILGICRGIQTLAIALDGTIHQDISDKAAIKHSQDCDRSTPTHTVTIDKDSLLEQLFNTNCLPVNSFHHQAVAEPGPHLRTVARSADGIIEAVESTEHKPVIGVQWHPEGMGKDGLPLFEWLVSEALTFRKIKGLHHQIVTLDTHCDTPMLFPQGIDFAQRDSRILVDLHKMTEGMLDATIMVAYLPQQMQTDGQAGKPFADTIFDKIESIVAANTNYLALARSPKEILVNKRQGKKSIMLGIENGIALDHDVSNVAYFARRGVVYITLCHNGDNDLCDSARSTQTHGGVSDFGKSVIEEMNRCGVMVDLSHAAESSFYDALDISSTPIVCSHSSARALCDHPRNLTDDQMRALAKAGGVCQITLYPGFLRTDNQASILDAMAHLDHAIEVMGIDHVGLGSDFDGDGGVPGLADASELPNFTRQLLARRYNPADIQKIWGGNFLRVMSEVINKKNK